MIIQIRTRSALVTLALLSHCLPLSLHAYLSPSPTYISPYTNTFLNPLFINIIISYFFLTCHFTNFGPFDTQKLISPPFCFWTFQYYVDDIFQLSAQGASPTSHPFLSPLNLQHPVLSQASPLLSFLVQNTVYSSP
jgi:hypothetical protein